MPLGVAAAMRIDGGIASDKNLQRRTSRPGSLAST
jgi:hypothetical protein